MTGTGFRHPKYRPLPLREREPRWYFWLCFVIVWVGIIGLFVWSGGVL